MGAEAKRISYRDTCVALACSRRQVLRFVETGELTPQRELPTGHCRVWFDSEQVTALAKRYRGSRRAPTKPRSIPKIDGRKVAEVFRLLGAGKDLRAIVIATELHPQIVRDLEGEWRTGFEDARKLREHSEQEKREREEQKAFDKRERDREWREQQIKIAKLTGEKRTRAG